MTLFKLIYDMVIGPLKYIFEIIFSVGYLLTSNAGAGIIILSFTLNILLLPLYKKADELQKKENDIQMTMKPDLDFIKKTFKGNERFYLIQTYYRQHNYKPIYSLRSSISLLLQVPFFIAAYDFLSNLHELNGVSSLFINDLGKPDGLLFGMNLLPILMTVINILSTIVYTKGQSLKQRIQLYIMALLFLVLLYNTPSALSFYYLLNNIFSLIKNIISKLKNKTKVISVFGIITSIAILFMLISHYRVFVGITFIILILITFVIFTISIYSLIHGGLPEIRTDFLPYNRYSFFVCCLLLCVLTGLFIPSLVINASPEEFIDRASLTNPVSYIVSSFTLSIGLFLIWLNIYYLLMEEKYKRLFSLFIWIICFVALVDYLFFYNGFGTMSNQLVYDVVPEISTKEYLLNCLVVVSIAVLLSFLWIKKNSIYKIVIAITASMFLMSLFNISNINNIYISAKDKLDKYHFNSQIFDFSKNKKNVVVFMLDRAISAYFPYLLQEKPELQKQFSGFTYYPNTISFGGFTNTSTPSLFGGYEYTPEEINKRSSELLVDKQNEALKVMPYLFDDNGYDVVVCDPPYAGYSWIPDLSIYGERPDISAYMTIGSLYNYEEPTLDNLNRNLFCYSITKIMPLFFFNTLYNDGNYLCASSFLENSKLIKNDFLDNYQVLEHLSDLSFVEEKDEGLFLMIQNSTTHEPVLMKEPDYKEVATDGDFNLDRVKTSITGESIQITTDYQLIHYHANMASMIQIGKWFDYLKEEGVYDNTKIIIVSDHGRNLGQFDELQIYDDDMMMYNALLLIKDFNDTEFKIDDSFMTLADVPFLTTEDVIDDPVNGFTGKEIKEMDKSNKKFNVFGTDLFDVDENNGYQFIEDKWYSVHDNCLDPSNWEIIDPLK